ncbi:MAG: hypothetical protein J6Z47_04660 [Bacteroidales bacterium]|nr:hypothetical protein [Bacteroidales bacterium]
MKRMNGLSLALAFVSMALCASTCEKMEPGDYRDHLGNKINLLGGWVLSEVQYKTAGIIESRGVDARSVMEFAGNGLGYTKSFSGAVEDTWHYEIYRAAVTIYTEAEWENNKGLGEDDDQYERGKTYYFHIVDDDTVTSEEKISSNTYVVNVYSRFKGPFRVSLFDDELYSPDTLLILYDEGTGKGPLLKAVEEYGAELKYDYKMMPGIAIRIPEGSDIYKAISWFKGVEGVVSVERDRIYHLIDPVKPRLEVK